MERAVTDISRLLRFSKEYEKIGAEPFRWQDVHAVANIAVSEIKWGRTGFSNEIKGLQIKADMLLEQVFHHIIDNSIKHGETTTSIRLRFEIRDPDVIIIVEDDGKGIPAEQKERIFARSLGNNGGLGLFLCREILSATGLEIWETGEPGQVPGLRSVCPPGRTGFLNRFLLSYFLASVETHMNGNSHPKHENWKNEF